MGPLFGHPGRGLALVVLGASVLAYTGIPGRLPEAPWERPPAVARGPVLSARPLGAELAVLLEEDIDIALARAQRIAPDAPEMVESRGVVLALDASMGSGLPDPLTALALWRHREAVSLVELAHGQTGQAVPMWEQASMQLASCASLVGCDVALVMLESSLDTMTVQAHELSRRSGPVVPERAGGLPTKRRELLAMSRALSEHDPSETGLRSALIAEYWTLRTGIEASFCTPREKSRVLDWSADYFSALIDARDVPVPEFSWFDHPCGERVWRQLWIGDLRSRVWDTRSRLSELRRRQLRLEVWLHRRLAS